MTTSEDGLHSELDDLRRKSDRLLRQLQEQEGSSPREEMIEEINEEADRLENLVKEVLQSDGVDGQHAEDLKELLDALSQFTDRSGPRAATAHNEVFL